MIAMLLFFVFIESYALDNTYKIPLDGRNIVIHNINYSGHNIDVAAILKPPFNSEPMTQPSKLFFSEIQAWCKQHPLKMIMIGCSLFSAIVCIKIGILEYELRKYGYWHRWKESTDFDLLLTMPRKELMQELRLYVSQHYAQPEYNNNCLLLVNCINALDKEITIVTQLQYIYEWLTFFKVSSVFSLLHNQQFFSDKKRRLLYFKNLILDVFENDAK